MSSTKNKVGDYLTKKVEKRFIVVLVVRGNSMKSVKRRGCDSKISSSVDNLMCEQRAQCSLFFDSRTCHSSL